MKILLQSAMLLLALSISGAEVVDRMVAVVNKQVVLQSELDQTARVEFLLEGKPLDKLTAVDLQQVLDQLIDRALLEQQIMNPSVLDPTPADVVDRLREVRTRTPGAGSDAQWQALLTRYGVTEQDVSDQVISQLRIVKFIDLRFRAMAQVDRAAITSYYQEKLLPELRKQGAPEPPLDQVAGKIEKILFEQRIDDLLNSWLQTLRSQANIQKIVPETKLADGAAR